MSNVNYYPQNPIIKQDQPVNSHFIQKILDENVSLIHTIMDKQQQHHTQESDELLKNLHKNLIYLATIADQTTSAGNQGSNVTSSNQYNYNGQMPPGTLPNQAYHTNMPLQQPSQMAQTYLMPGNEVVDKKPQTSEEDPNKDMMNKSDFCTNFGVDMDKDCEKILPTKDVINQPPMSNKTVDIDRDCPPNMQNVELSKDMVPPKTVNMPDVLSKSDESMFVQNQNANIKTDMPPPSQLPLGVHPDKNPAHYPPNQRFAYPGVNPNFNQYNPHYDQSNKFYPQSPFQQQSPYNYQGMYSPYQQVPPPPAMTQGHYNQHMMNQAPVYSQYPYYQQQPGTMDHISSAPKDPGPINSQLIHGPSNTMGQQMKQQPISEAQSSTINPTMTD